MQAAYVAGEEVDGAGDVQRRGEQGAGELREAGDLDESACAAGVVVS
jgi:hypothetical protein